MVQIRNTKGQSLLLDFAQMYSLEGKNRIMIADYSQLRAQPYGPKLSNLEVVGYFSVPEYGGKTGLELMNDLFKYFDESKDGVRTTQFYIGILNPMGHGEILSKRLPKFRGVIESIKVSMNVQKTTLVNYSITFLVYPFNKTTSAIRDVY